MKRYMKKQVEGLNKILSGLFSKFKAASPRVIAIITVSAFILVATPVAAISISELGGARQTGADDSKPVVEAKVEPEADEAVLPAAEESVPDTRAADTEPEQVTAEDNAVGDNDETAQTKVKADNKDAVPAEDENTGNEDEPPLQADPDEEPAFETKTILTPADTVFIEGMQSPVINDVQARLMELGYMESDETTDLYGPITSSAIELFQRKHELPIDGELGEQTYDLLMSDSAKNYSVSVGVQGVDVEELQIRLRELGYLEAVTGYFGTETETAVRKFQERNDIEPDGSVGVVTREKLYSEDVKANVLSLGDESPDIEKYQQKLKTLGYLTTTPDGEYGGDTVAAVKRFQERNSLIADGNLGPQTKDLLMSEDAQANALGIGMKGTDVENMQKRLEKYGYLDSPTGYYGEVTEKAVRSFQKRNGLTVDGKVGAGTMSVLSSSDAVSAESKSSGDGSSSDSSSDKKQSSSSDSNKSSNKSSSSDSDKSSSKSSTSSNSDNSSKDDNSSSDDSDKNDKNDNSDNDDNSDGSGSGVEAFISIAESKLGSKYVRGGKGPNSFDCSGFVYWCLNKAGVKQGYMTSSSWQGTGKYQRISKMSDLKRGDVISFKGHVGIALGGGKMIDASSSQGKVRIGNLSNSYWKRNFVRGYRIF